MKQQILIFLALLLMAGCLGEEKIDTSVRVQALLPEGYESFDLSLLEMSLYNKSTGMIYKAKCDKEGITSFDVEYGFYDAALQYKFNQDGEMNIFNGRTDNIMIVPDGTKKQDLYTLQIVGAKSSQIIFKEIYYAGTQKTGGTSYYNDKYITLYNNSDQTTYLDGLCFGYAFPSPTKASSFINSGIVDRLPILYVGWTFPGTGEEHPLLPGEDVVIAFQAIDHTTLATQSVDLRTADYVFYRNGYTVAPALGVTPLDAFWESNGRLSSYPVGFKGEAFVIFRIEGMTPAEFANKPENIMKEPGKPTGTDYLMIPVEYVLDGVECVTSSTETFKRLPTSIDAGFIYVDGSGCFQSVIRKVQEVVDGRTVYEDTNNSTGDFTVTVPTLKK